MDNSIFSEIIRPVEELLSANGFKSADGKFESDTALYKVFYDDSRKQVILSFKDKSAEAGEETELAGWLFDGDVKSDAVVIAEDFCDIISKKLGVKQNGSASAASVAMPTKAAAGEENGINSLTQKLLAIYPAFKNDYKESVAKYNTFLYVDFYKATVVPKIRELLAYPEANKKALSKVFNMLGDVYYNCDKETSEAICGVIIAGAFLDTPEKFKECEEMLADYPVFRDACREIIALAKQNKKFREVFKA